MENGSLKKKNAGLEDQKPKRAKAGSSEFYNQLFFKRSCGGTGQTWGEPGGGREFPIQTIPWFSARSKVWEFCGTLGSGTQENVTCSFWHSQILALGG